MPLPRQPIALTIAGSDSGGGAGIQADLKTFAAHQVHGTSAITCITAQNPGAVHAIVPISPRMLRAQIQALFSGLPPQAAKTGMLYSRALISAICSELRQHPRLPLVVDPVMISTSGHKLISASAIQSLINDLFPLATLLTPNLPEAAALLGEKICSLDDLSRCAALATSQWGCAVLIKGGHLKSINEEAVDVLRIGTQEWILRAPRIRGVHTHGTGCTYAAAITANLALGKPLETAVHLAKHYITQCIQRSVRVGKYTALGHTFSSK